ncbi:MAG: hypothetical protein WBE72_16825 [Terracidiphilus sp.]
MNSRILLDKLIEIERSIGVESNAALLIKVFEAENCVLELQKALVEMLGKERTHLVLQGSAERSIAA